MGSPRTRGDRRSQKDRFNKNIFESKDHKIEEYLRFNYYTNKWEGKRVNYERKN